MLRLSLLGLAPVRAWGGPRAGTPLIRACAQYSPSRALSAARRDRSTSRSSQKTLRRRQPHKVKARADHVKRKVDVASRLQELLNAPGETVAEQRVNYNNLLHASRDDVGAVEQIIQQMDREAIPKDAMTYLTWMRTLARAGRLADAEQVYEEAKSTKFIKSVPLHNAMLNALAGAGDTDKCFEVWWAMRSLGLKPSEYTLCALLRAVTASRDDKRLALVWEELVSAGVEPQALGYSALVVAYTQCGNFKLAVEVLELAEKTSVLSSCERHARVSFNVLLSAIHPEEPAGQQTVQKLFGMMESLGVEANRVTFHSLMINSSSEYIEALMEAMRDTGIGVCTETINLLLKAKLQEEPHSTMALYDEMNTLCANNKLKPDVYTFGLLVKSAANMSNPDLAFQFVEKMQEEGFKVPHTTITSLIWSCSPRGGSKHLEMQGLEDQMNSREQLQSRLKQVSQLMKAEHLQHNVITATAMIAAFGRGQLAGAAAQVFRQLDPSAPNVRTYNNLITATMFGRYYLTWVLELVNNMESQGVQPNLSTFNKLIHNCSQAEELDLAFSVPGMLEAHGLQPNGHTYTNLIQAAITNGEWKEGYKLLDTLDKSRFTGMEINRAYDLMIKASHKEGSPTEVLDLTNRALASGFELNGYTVQWPVKAMLQLKKPDRALKLLNKVNRGGRGGNYQSRRYLMAKWYDMVAPRLKKAARSEATEKAATLRKIYASHLDQGLFKMP